MYMISSQPKPLINMTNPCNMDLHEAFLNRWGKTEDFHFPIVYNSRAIVFAFAQTIGDKITFKSRRIELPKDIEENEYPQDMRDIMARVKLTMEKLGLSHSK